MVSRWLLNTFPTWALALLFVGGFMLFGADEDFGDPSISLPGRNGKRK